MNRRRKLLVALGAYVAAPLNCFAQQQAKVWHIGYLAVSSEKTGAPLLDAFQSGMRDLGYVDGRNLVIE